MVKQSVVHPYHRILLSNKKEWTIDRCIQAGWISRKLYWVKKPIHKGYTLYDSTYRTLLKWQNGNGKQIRGCQGLKRGGGGRREVGSMRAAWGMLVVVEMFSVLCRQYPGWDIVLEIRKMFPLGKDEERGHRICLDYFTTTCGSTVISK